MANRLLKSPSVRVTPGVPGRPATPAYCTDVPLYVDYGYHVVAETMLGMNRDIHGRKAQAIDPNITQMFTGPGSPAGIYVGYLLRTCHKAQPAVPAIPAKRVYDNQPGWNSGGLSARGFDGDGYFEFVIGPASIGVIIGISTSPDTLSPADCSHAFYAHLGALEVFESGAAVKTVSVPLTERPVLRIARSGTEVSYLVDGRVVHTSSKASHGHARLDASLYMAGDYVDNPQWASFNVGAASGEIGVHAFIDPRPRAAGSVSISGSAQGLAGSRRYSAAAGVVGIQAAAVGWAEHQGIALGAVGVQGVATPPRNRSRGVRRGALGVSSDRAYAFSAGQYRGGYSGDSLGGFPDIEFTFAAGFAPAYLGFSMGKTGGVATVEGMMPAAKGVAGESGYSFSRGAYGGSYLGLSFEPWLDNASVLMREPVLLEDAMHLQSDIYATFISAIEVSSGIVLEMEFAEGLEWHESILADSAMSETGDRLADLFDQIAVTTQTNIPSLEGIQYATNVETGAITRYSGFDFMAIANTPYGSIGIRNDGIYRLGQGSDDGEGIDLLADFGASDYGTSLSKRVESVYFGLATDGHVIAVLKADDGAEHAYQVVNREPVMRAVTAKGVQGKTWRLCLKVFEATQAELDSVDVSLGVSTRRLPGGRR